MPEIKDIYEQITSNDTNVLKSCLKYITEMNKIEKERIDSTERKATTLLGFGGLISSFILTFGKLLFDLKFSINIFSYILLIATYIISACYLFSTLYHALEALKVKNYYHGFNITRISNNP